MDYIGAFAMRQFIRHPTDIPIMYHVVNENGLNKNYLNNIGDGGISFHSSEYISPHKKISVRFPFISNTKEVYGVVVWCEKIRDSFNVGVRFKKGENEYRMRMMEQVCYIEQYKKDVLKDEHRYLTGEAAAREWIDKFAQSFPKIN